MMLALTRELAFIRQQIQQAMVDSVSIYSLSTTRNGEGFPTTIRTLVATKHGALMNPSGNERQLITDLVDAGVENIETMKLILPFGTNISVNNEVDTADGKAWNVIHTTTSQTLNGTVEVLLYRRVVNNTVVE